MLLVGLRVFSGLRMVMVVVIMGVKVVFFKFFVCECGVDKD